MSLTAATRGGASATTSSLHCPVLFRAEDLAERWQVPVSQVYRLTRQGDLPAVRVGRYYRYRRESVERWERLSEGASDV
jgi:excisionase family DNA binding protein